MRKIGGENLLWLYGDDIEMSQRLEVVFVIRGTNGKLRVACN